MIVLEGETSNILATCGGHNICLIDCQTGKVLKRYKDASKTEVMWNAEHRFKQISW